MIDNNWQPAIVLSADKMCPLHKKIYEEVASRDPEVRMNREALIGKKVLVYVIPIQGIYEDLTKEEIQNGECLPMRIKRDDGLTAGCFSCELSTD